MTMLVAWKEGMALSQQHLQQSDKFILGHIKNVLGLPKGMHFGFSKLMLEENLIKEGQFAFEGCEVVFPSGVSFVDSEDKFAKIEARNFTKIFDQSLNSLDVFLALDLSKLVQFSEDQSTRFKVTWKDCSDLYSAEDSVSVPVCVPAPFIVFGTESLDGKEFLPVARILRNLQGSFEVDKNFYPPLTFLNGYEYFSKKIKYFDTLLQSRIEYISHSKELLLRDFKSLRAILICMQSTEGVLPFHFFCEILKILQEPFTYNHAEFDKCFNNIFAALNDFLLSEKKAAFLQKRFSKEGPSSFFANLADFEILPMSSVWLAVESKLYPEEAVKLMPLQLKIAPKSKLSGLVVSATHGINCVHSIVPKTIQEMPGTFYFKLQTDSFLWKNLCDEKEIGIYAPNALQIISIDILVEN
ncbi:MAG: type VI secretion system baseplate subunit TssK [Fibromonadaceae bacterium]|jgi:predicted component of type VI protein secretion system|nr:type VI secretion system baseplate subunit TssK [Fibromonadaceae bacterium]